MALGLKSSFGQGTKNLPFWPNFLFLDFADFRQKWGRGFFFGGGCGERGGGIPRVVFSNQDLKSKRI